MTTDEMRTKAIPMGTRIRTAMHGTLTVSRPLPAPPRGYWRCWFCCTGRLVSDEVTPADHRFAMAPTAADPDRVRLEREHDAEDEERERARQAHPSRGGWASSTGDLLRRRF